MISGSLHFKIDPSPYPVQARRLIEYICNVFALTWFSLCSYLAFTCTSLCSYLALTLLSPGLHLVHLRTEAEAEGIYPFSPLPLELQSGQEIFRGVPMRPRWPNEAKLSFIALLLIYSSDSCYHNNKFIMYLLSYD